MYSAKQTRELTQVPENVDELRKLLLDVERTIPQEALSLFAAKDNRPDSVPLKSTGYNPQGPGDRLKAEEHKKDIIACEKMAELFEEMSRESESEWVQELSNNVFKSYKHVRPVELRQQHE